MRLRSIILLLAIGSFAAADPDRLVLEELVLQSPERGGARVIGLIRNTTDDFIVTPVLEVVVVAKGKPDEPQKHRLRTSAKLGPRETRAFHTGEFFGPPMMTADGDSIPRQIVELRSAEIPLSSMRAAGQFWEARLEGRSGYHLEIHEVESQHGEWWVSGTVDAPVGSRVQMFRVTVSCFDASQNLIDVRTFRIRPRGQNCIDEIPLEFKGLASRMDADLDTNSVRTVIEEIELCP